MDQNNEQPPVPQTTSQPQNINTNQPLNNAPKNFNKILLILLIILLLPIIYILIRLGLTGFIIYSNLSRVSPKPTPSSYTNIPSSSDNKLEQLRTQARNELRTVEINSMAVALEKYYGSEGPNKYPSVKDEWFATGKIPADPLGYEYMGVPKEATPSFTLCANLEDATPNQYCVKSKY